MKLFRTLFAALAAVLALAFVAAPAAAQDDPWDRLYSALEAGVDQQLAMDAMLGSVARSILRSDPTWRDLEKGNRGLLMAMTEAIRPTMLVYSERVRLQYRPRIVAAMRQVLSAEEATSVADFYASDLGRRVLQATVSNLGAEAIMDEALSGGEVSADAVGRDMRASGQRGFATLTEAEQAEVIRRALTVPGLAKMGQMMQVVAPIRAEMENAPLTRSEERAFAAAIESVARSYGL
jgi:hypothetical protein